MKVLVELQNSHKPTVKVLIKLRNTHRTHCESFGQTSEYAPHPL